MKKTILCVLIGILAYINTHAQVELNKALNLYLPFTNSLADASDNGAVASKINGGPGFGYDRNNQLNNALAFNGNGSLRLNAGNGALDFGTFTSFTMSFWIRTAKTTHQDLFYETAFSGVSGITLSLSEYVVGELYLTVRSYDTRDWILMRYKDAALLDNKWHHLLILADQSSKNIGLYIDGQLKSSVSFAGKEPDFTPEDRTKIYIGESMEGGYDELRFYSRLLNKSEIDSLAGKSRGSSVAETPHKQFTEIKAWYTDRLHICYEQPMQIDRIRIFDVSGREAPANPEESISPTACIIGLPRIKPGIYIACFTTKSGETYSARFVVP